MKFKKLIAIVVMASVAIFLFFFFFRESPEVGILLPTDNALGHTDARIGFLMAMKSLPDDVRFVDVNYTSNTLKTAIEKAARKGIRYFVADNYSSDLERIGNILESTHSILIESMVTNPNALESAKCAYTLSPTDDVQAAALAAYIRMKGFKSVVVIDDTTNLEYVNYLSLRVIADLKGIKCARVTLNDLESIKKAPDLFLLITSTNDAIKAIGFLKDKFPQSAFLGSDWTFQNLMFSNTLVNGFVTVGFVDPLYLKTKMSRPSGSLLPITPNSVLAYDALKVAYMLAKKRVRWADVGDYLEEHTFFGLTSSFSFYGLHATMPVYFYEVTLNGLKLAWKFGG